MIRPAYYLYVLIIIGIVSLFIALFKGSLFNRLSTRIVTIILLSAPISAILFPLATRFLTHFEIIGTPDSFSTTAFYVLFALTIPLTLGLLAARFVRRPLKQFNDTLSSLKQSNYKVQLEPTGIGEFDEVFSEFNDLIKRLRHEEKLRKDLISDTSHELNTPLTTMIGQLTAIQEGKLPVTDKRIATLKQQAERLSDLVEQLNTYTKVRAQSNGKREDIMLHSFCQELVDQFKLDLQQKSITVKLEIEKDQILHANHNALRQILTNLFQNSLRYSAATEITITTTSHELFFSDNGKGVPSESLIYLFERFYRVEESRNRKTGGLGLGLAIVKEVAEQQGWDIHAKHARPGLTFVLTFS